MTSSDRPIGDHPQDDLAAYALDALDGSERLAVTEHLGHCGTCREDLASYHETLAQLAPEEPPPAAVWDRVVADISIPPHIPAPLPLTPRRRVVVLAAAASIAVALGVGGAIGFALGSDSGDTNIGELAEQAAAEPGGQLATLVSSTGDPVAQVVADGDGAYVVLDGLENLPEGRAYQLWSLTDSEPVSLGMLGRDGSNTIAFRLPPTITELAITEAPTSGDPVPDGAFLASGSVTRS